MISLTRRSRDSSDVGTTRKFAFCSEACEWIFGLEPQRYQGYVHFYEKFEG